MRSAKSQVLLLLPALAVFVLFLTLPMLTVLDESFRVFEPGRIGVVKGSPLTIENYRELAVPVYVRYFMQTYLLAFCASVLAIVFAFPIAYYVAKNASPRVRKIAVAALVGLMFLNALVRVYSIQLTFGTAGILAPIMSALGGDMNSALYLKLIIIAGLLHYAVPMSVLILIGAIQSLNPRMMKAAQSLGASAFTTHLTITVPLCIKGLPPHSSFP